MNSWRRIQELAKNGHEHNPEKVVKTDQEWKELLDPDTYRITRQHGTERPFSSEMCSAFDPGEYGCACCNTPLFDSEVKFDSGSGWPSFSDPVVENVVAYRSDVSFGMRRIEALCNVCEAHLGHVFPDGPPPSGLRYCINALALKKLSSQNNL